jgi:MTH538 TIR-like domain (DUF1863)
MANNPFFLPQIPTIKRKVYFAFHFADIMRVNNVRNAWKIDHPDAVLNRSFYDSSIWEKKAAMGDESVKQLIRDGVGYTSAVCVLAGTETWNRRWVRYEIARAVIDGRGLLAVHINGINSHLTSKPDPLGYNPLDNMGIARKANGKLYLCEWQNGRWEWYTDYTDSVSLPPYLGEPVGDSALQLSTGARVYDYARETGSTNIGAWIDAAARQVNR